MLAHKSDLRAFDYEKVARYDSQMWRAYYNHHFLKLFGQLLRLIKNQLGMSWPQTLRAAYLASWAAADYRLNRGGVNKQRILKNLTQFYKIVSTKSTSPFDYRKAAESELKWWDVHRSSYKNNQGLEDSLAESAAIIYNVPPAALKTYARYRAEAMIIPQHEGDGQPQPPDWRRVHQLLVEAWQSLHEAVKAENGHKN